MKETHKWLVSNSTAQVLIIHIVLLRFSSFLTLLQTFLASYHEFSVTQVALLEQVQVLELSAAKGEVETTSAFVGPNGAS